MARYKTEVWLDYDAKIIDIVDTESDVSFSQDYYPEAVDIVEQEALVMLEWVRVAREFESQGKL